MKSNKSIIAINIAIISLMLLANIAAAVEIPGVPGAPGSTLTVTGWFGILNQVVSWVYRIFFVVAALFIIIAAFYYLTAQGNPEKVGEAKNMIIYAVVAIVVALIAVGIDVMIRTFLSTGGQQ